MCNYVRIALYSHHVDSHLIDQFKIRSTGYKPGWLNATYAFSIINFELNTPSSVLIP